MAWVSAGDFKNVNKKSKNSHCISFRQSSSQVFDRARGSSAGKCTRAYVHDGPGTVLMPLHVKSWPEET